MSPQQENPWDFGPGPTSTWNPEPGLTAPRPRSRPSGSSSSDWGPRPAAATGGPLLGAPSSKPGALRTNTLLLVGATLAALSIAAGIAGVHHQPTMAIAGWLAASLGCMGCVAAFSYQDSKRRAADWVLASEPHSLGRFVVLALGLAAIVLKAWQFADWAAR